VGKWHLGNHNNSLPTQDPSFDFFWGIPYSHDIGVVRNLAPPVGPSNACPSCVFWAQTLGGLGVPLYENTQIIQQPVDATNFNANLEKETLNFIRSNRGHPFFLYVAPLMPHVPMLVGSKWQGSQLRGLYGDAVAELDGFVGRILAETQSCGITGKTFVVFTSDNGPWLSQGEFGGSAGPFRSGKGTGWEGGFRAPTIIYQPGRVLPGSTQALVSHLDWFPTFVELAGGKMPTDRHYDGKSLVPLLDWNIRKPPAYDKEFVIRDSIAYYINGILCAYRNKGFKAHFVTVEENTAPVVHNPPLLFNVEKDIGENFPLDITQPGNAQALGAIMAGVAALSQTYAVEPALPPVLATFTSAVPCCNPPTCQCG